MHRLALFFAIALSLAAAPPIQTASGLIQGAASADGAIHIFKGIPYAAPPVGDLRWLPPQPMIAWTGVRSASAFGARCMQGPIYSDMVFRDPGPSEDCLYLNIWSPAPRADARLPVMVWIHGGGFQAGASSEPRQDGETLARKGVLVVSMNYRLGIFGFFSHPELTRESAQHASGNYGLLDQTAALRWVHDNIAAFGGDPANVTIFGESAGSSSVNAQILSPLANGLLKQAIGESGGQFSFDEPLPSLARSERTGLEFASHLRAVKLKNLRSASARDLLDASVKGRGVFRFRTNIDGYFFPDSPLAIYQAGKQNRVAVIAGWNNDEMSAASFFGKDPSTRQSFDAKLKHIFGDSAPEALKFFPPDTPRQMDDSARLLSSAQFIAYSTWKWIELQARANKAPVYRYHFEEAPPVASGPSRGAYHSADIEYVFETLAWKKLPLTEADRRVSDQMSSYWTNFAKTGDPNGSGLPRWPRYSPEEWNVMHLGPETHATPDSHRPQFLFLDRFVADRAKGSDKQP